MNAVRWVLRWFADRERICHIHGVPPSVCFGGKR